MFYRKGILIPFYLLTSAGSRFDSNEVIGQLVKTKSFQDEIPTTWQHLTILTQRYLSKRKELEQSSYNDPHCRLVRMVDGINPDHTEKSLSMGFQETDWASYCVSNLSLDRPVADSRSLRSILLTAPRDYAAFDQSLLSNILGISVCFYSQPQEAFVLSQRRFDVEIDPGWYHLAAGGHVSYKDDVLDEKVDIFRAASREVREETGLQFGTEDLLCLGVGVDLRLAQPNALFMVRTTETAAEIWSHPKQDRDSDSFFPLSVAQKAISEFLREARMSPNNAVCMILAYEHLENCEFILQ